MSHTNTHNQCWQQVVHLLTACPGFAVQQLLSRIWQKALMCLKQHGPPGSPGGAAGWASSLPWRVGSGCYPNGWMSPLPSPTCSSKCGEVTMRGEDGDLDTGASRDGGKGRLSRGAVAPRTLSTSRICEVWIWSLLLSRFSHHQVSILHKVPESLNHGGERGGKLPTSNTNLHTDRHPKAYCAAEKVILLGLILLSYKIVQIHSKGGNIYLETLL